MSVLEDVVRPLTDSERRLLSSRIASQHHRRKRYVRRVAMVAIALSTCGSALTLAASRSVGDWPLIVLVWAGIGALIGLWILIEDNTKRRARVRRYEDARQRDEARAIHIQSAEVVEFEETEDEGACFAFQVGSQIVFIAGQEFYASARFPNSDFSLIEILDSRGAMVEMVLDVRGRKLKPLRTIPAVVQSALRIPEHRQILDGKLEDLERLLIADFS